MVIVICDVVITGNQCLQSGVSFLKMYFMKFEKRMQ